MAYVTPKTDWKSTDYFELVDYNRITGNIRYLHDSADVLYHMSGLNAMTENKTYESLIYASEFNAIENNLALLDADTYKAGITAKIWAANGSTPTFEDLNRIEGSVASLYSKLQTQYAKVKKFPLTLGA